ncbi:MAG: nucleotide-binding domain containing protein [Phycisphaerae bacterium]
MRAKVLGQILPGVPVWQSGPSPSDGLGGPESKFPDISYIVFPGNVGSIDAITEVVQGFREPKSR